MRECKATAISPEIKISENNVPLSRNKACPARFNGMQVSAESMMHSRRRARKTMHARVYAVVAAVAGRNLHRLSRSAPFLLPNFRALARLLFAKFTARLTRKVPAIRRHLHKPVSKEILILKLIKKLLKFSYTGRRRR